MNEYLIQELERLNIEDFIYILFIILSIINILGDNNQKKYLYTNDMSYQNKANNYFTFTIIIVIFIYLYYLSRNYNLYLLSDNKELLSIKVLGSTFLLIGTLCLLYFQLNNKENFIGTPAI